MILVVTNSAMFFIPDVRNCYPRSIDNRAGHFTSVEYLNHDEDHVETLAIPLTAGLHNADSNNHNRSSELPERGDAGFSKDLILSGGCETIAMIWPVLPIIQAPDLYCRQACHHQQRTEEQHPERWRKSVCTLRGCTLPGH